MRWTLALVASIALAPGSARAQDTTGFVVRLGRDTLVLERYVRTATRLSGEYVSRTPRAAYRTYAADLDAQGNVRRFELTTRWLDGGPGPATQATIVFQGDSAITTAPRGDSTVTTRVAAGPGAVPSLAAVMGLTEQLGRQARAAGGGAYAALLVSPGASSANRAVLTPGGGDTLKLMIQTQVGEVGPWYLRMDAGRLLEYRGSEGSPFQAIAERLPTLDMAAAREAFAHRPLGVLSARDTARTVLGGDTLWVDYGRPSKRGREIFGHVVPWNAVWRTGANAATHFRAPVDLMVGDTRVPAGTYTLWTLPTPSGWKLIVNKQTGQWGTQYAPEQDLARIAMRVEKMAQPVEQLTIAFDPGGKGATLGIAWDRTRASVPVRRAR